MIESRLGWRQVLYGFLFGCMVGALAGAWVQRSASHKFWKRGPSAERVAKKLTQKLSLDASQQAVVKVIIDAHHAKVMALRNETDASFAQARKAMHAEIRATLRPEQQQKLDEMQARWDARKMRKEMD